MKKQLLLQVVFFVMLFLTSCSPNAKNILKGAYEKCQSVNNGYYEMEKYLKLMSSNDTIQIPHSSYFEKIEDNSLIPFIYSSHLSSPGMGEINLLFTGDHFLSFVGNDGRILSRKDRGKDIWNLYVKNPAFSTYLPITYDDSRPMLDSSMLASEKVKVKFIKEEMINGILCSHVSAIVSPEYDYSLLKEYNYIVQTEFNY